MTKSKKWLWLIAALLIVTIFATLTHNKKSPGVDYSGTSSSLENPPSITVTAIEVNGGWGYQIKVDGQNFILQDRIPGVPGGHAFANQADAIKCGELVMVKIMNNTLPSITVAELDSMGIEYPRTQLP